MGSKIVKTIVGLLICVVGFQASAKSLSFGESSPEEYFNQDPEARKSFIIQVMENPELSDNQKEAYKALVGMNSELSGDAVLDQIDAKELAWYYGWAEEDTQVDTGEEKLYQTSKINGSVGAAQYNDCLSRALCVMVSKGSQRIYVFKDGEQMMINGRMYNPVSTARSGKVTPNGIFSVNELAGRWRTSGKYTGAALYYAMQFHGNYFIHATSADNYSKLGSPASAGCVRTKLAFAEPLNFEMRAIGGRRSGVLADSSTVRVIVNSSIPDHYLQYF